MDYKYCPHCGECLIEEIEIEVEIDPELFEQVAREEHEIKEWYRERYWKKKGWKNFKPKPFNKKEFKKGLK